MQAFRGAPTDRRPRVDTVKAQAGETWDNLEKIFQTRVQRAWPSSASRPRRNSRR